MKEEYKLSSKDSQRSDDRDRGNWLIGRVLGKYRLVKSIGSGAFASIYEAEHIHLNVPFAIKILHPAFMNHEEVVTRFFREAQAASQLQHENVVFIADFDVEEDVGPYIVMEYLEGHTLKHLVAEEGALPLELVGEICRQICQVLTLAHRKGIVHRDLKPDNIFLVAREMGRILVKILDFGIAHLAASSESITGARLMGTPIYMAPEQFRGASNSPSLDIYSFGVILYELLTGKPPFQGQNVQQLGIEHLLIPAPELDESFPSGLRQLQARLLAKTPEERPSDMAEVWSLLAPALDPEGQFPHWHQKEPRLTSASLPALSILQGGSKSKTPPPASGGLVENEMTAKHTPVKEPSQPEAPSMSDTILSSDDFQLTQGPSVLEEEEILHSAEVIDDIEMIDDLEAFEEYHEDEDFIPDHAATVVAKKNHLVQQAQQLYAQDDKKKDAAMQMLQHDGAIRTSETDDTGEVEMVTSGDVWKTSEVPIPSLDEDVDASTEIKSNGKRPYPRVNAAKPRTPVPPASFPPLVSPTGQYQSIPKPSFPPSAPPPARTGPHAGPAALPESPTGSFSALSQPFKKFNRKERRTLGILGVAFLFMLLGIFLMILPELFGKTQKKPLPEQRKSGFIESGRKGQHIDKGIVRVSFMIRPPNTEVWRVVGGSESFEARASGLILRARAGQTLHIRLKLDGHQSQDMKLSIPKNKSTFNVSATMVPKD